MNKISPEPTDCIADDTLRGCAAIAAHIKRTERQTQHLLDQGNLPAFKIGGRWHMRKSTYCNFIAEVESRAFSRAASKVAA